MAQKQYFFSVDELEGIIRNAIAVRSPSVATVIDPSIILGSIVDIVMYGQPIKQPFSPLEVLTDLFVPTDIAKETIDYLCDIINRSLTASMGEINSKAAYEWEITPGYSDLIITMTTPRQYYPRDIRVDSQQITHDLIETAMDNWDYIPEKVRRIVGG